MVATNSAQAALPMAQAGWSSKPLTGFFWAYLLTASTLVAAAYMWGRAGADLIVVGLGWPHVILGLLFYINRVIRNEGKQRVYFTGLLALTAAIGFVHSLATITTLIYLYFVLHAFRDEIFIALQRENGHRYAGPVFTAGGWALLSGTVALALLAQPGVKRFLGLNAAVFGGVPYGVDLATTALALVLAACGVFRWPGAVFQRAPGLACALPAGFLMLAAVTGLKIGRHEGFPVPLFFTFLVVFHYFSWYVFYLEKLRERPAPASSQPVEGGFNRLLRYMTTRQGFINTVLTMNAVSFAGAYAYQVLGAGGGLNFLFDLKYFLYVLVFHVTVSFAPKGGSKAPAPKPA
jgi:hypothetical protein